MIDVSDGIALDLNRICGQSGVGAKIYHKSLPLSYGLSLKNALYWGESFELLFTMDEKNTSKLAKDIEKKYKDFKFFIIGEITKKRKGINLVYDNGRTEPLRMKGFEHM